MNIKKELNDHTLTIKIDGILNSSTSQLATEELKDEPINEATKVVIDLQDLEYLSSAGLRLILNLKKESGKKEFSVINVNLDVLKIFNDTGFSEIMTVVPAYRKVSVEGCKKIGAGACGECYRLDDETIIKLYYSKITKEEIEREKELAKKAFILGAPTAISYDIVECDGRKGVIYELIQAKTLSELIRNDMEHIDKYIDMYADVCKSIHSIVLENNSGLPYYQAAANLDIDPIDEITNEEKAYLHKFYDLIPNCNHCIHGDLNMNNIMIQDGKPVIIDMGEFSIANPIVEMGLLHFSFAYVNPKEGMNDFYHLPSDVCRMVQDKLFDRYFGTHDLEEIKNTHPYGKWLEPVAWFRFSTSILKSKTWLPELKPFAREILREKLIPFIKENE